MIRQNLHNRDKLTAAEYQELSREKSKKSNSLYGNNWVTVDGIKFQSQAEANYYGKLKMRKAAKDIKGFTRQQKWDFVLNGVFICSWKCDFTILENDGTETVVDVKSDWTEALYIFEIKRNMMKAFFNISVKAVK